MNCAEFEILLDGQLAASHLAEPGELAEHAAHCAACRALRDRYRLLAESIVLWRDQTPDVDLASAVVASPQFLSEGGDLAQEGTAPSETRVASPMATRRDRGAASGSAAALRRHSGSRLAVFIGVALVFLALTIALLRDQRPAALPPVAHDPPQATSPLDSPRQSQLVVAPAGAVRDVGNRELSPGAPDLAPYSGLAQMATSALGQATALMLPRDSVPQMPGSAKSPEREGWIDDLQDQLKPVGRGLGNAFDFLWQAGQSVDG
jgi:hypothetical protein